MKTDESIVEFIKLFAELAGAPEENMIADFKNFSKAIDEKIAEGYSEEEARSIVVSSWNFAWWDKPIKE